MVKWFKNLKIGKKIGVTFFLLLLIALILAWITIENLKDVEESSVRLAREYAPEVAEAGSLERNSLMTMYNMRGYGLSNEARYLNEGQEYLKNVLEDIESAKELVARYPDLTKLKEQIADAESAVNDYRDLVEKTVARNSAISENRENLYRAAERYMGNGQESLDNHFATLSQEILSGSDTPALIERIEKVRLLTRLINQGNEIRVANFKAQALGNPEMLREALKQFSLIHEIIDGLIATSRQDDSLRRIQEIDAAAESYEAAMKNLLENSTELNRLNEERNETARRVLEIAESTFDAGMDRMQEVSEETVTLVNESTLTLWIGLIAAALIGTAILIVLTRLITAPIYRISAFTRRFGQGDLSEDLDIDTKDEIGGMASDLNSSVGSLREILRQLSDNTNSLAGSSEELSAVSAEMAASAEEMNSQADTVAAASEQVNASVGMVASAAEESNASVSGIAAMTEEMSSTFENVARASRKTSENVAEMAGSGEQMSKQVDSVASAAEEMTASLNEVAKNTVKASRISQDAKERTKEIDIRMDALVNASKQIGKVVGVIKDIADQTNMLALNATIEAAGAGDAGRGFAVVAGEVKELARQSADATDEIADQIDQIRRSTNDAVSAIEEINSIIENIASINEMIASSAEEQTATAGEISKSVAAAAATVKNVATNATESSQLVEDIARSTDEASKTATEVARNIDELLNGIKEVARASDEASRGVNDISMNIQNISEAARQTSEGASQTDQSSQELSEMAQSLARIVDRFKL